MTLKQFGVGGWRGRGRLLQRGLVQFRCACFPRKQDSLLLCVPRPATKSLILFDLKYFLPNSLHTSCPITEFVYLLYSLVQLFNFPAFVPPLIPPPTRTSVETPQYSDVSAFNYSSQKVGGSLTHENIAGTQGYRVKSSFAEFDDRLNYGATVLRWFDSRLN